MIFFTSQIQGEDYLSDLILQSILTHFRGDVTFSSIPEYIWSVYPSKLKLYGRGYSVYRNIDKRQKKKNHIISRSEQTFIEEVSAYSKHKKTTIIISSIWRSQQMFDILAKLAKRRETITLICIDGEDHNSLHEKAIESSYYFKRELLNKQKLSDRIQPISFLFPEVKSPFITAGVSFIPRKTVFLAPCDPRNKASYTFETESAYYNQYKSAYFAITTSKGGWDCMRHYEILANHCLPVFPNITNKPALTMANYPTELQIRANNLFWQYSGSQTLDKKFFLLYESILSKMLEWFYRKSLSNQYINLLKI